MSQECTFIFDFKKIMQLEKLYFELSTDQSGPERGNYD